MLQLALCQELDAVTASRQYCVVFIGYQYDDDDDDDDSYYLVIFKSF